MLRRREGTVWERLSNPSPDPPRYSGARTGSNSPVRETAARVALLVVNPPRGGDAKQLCQPRAPRVLPLRFAFFSRLSY